jgi:hypothetical protein
MGAIDMPQPVTAAVVLALVLVGCGSRWPEETVRNYTQACLFNAKTALPTTPDATLIAYCDCTADEWQRRYTHEEFVKLEALAAAAKTPPAELQEVMTACGATPTQPSQP